MLRFLNRIFIVEKKTKSYWHQFNAHKQDKKNTKLTSRDYYKNQVKIVYY